MCPSQRIDMDRRAVSSFSPLSKFNTINIAKLLSCPCRAKRNTRPCPDFPASLHKTVPVWSAPSYLVHTSPTLHFFIRLSYIIHFFQNGRATVLDVDCHSILYLFYGPSILILLAQQLPIIINNDIFSIQHYAI